ncbi:unnamed protein product [Tilletia caries]|nr:hypothetical protein CF335_g1044 [Tilletia laevis]CAD6909041.1 unnamed protein product [Tilletia controversa]CAD6913234.1 unnamed protein product [Tilletia caries]CAD6930906.1 unnamed protein product [Tilletia caries]CAD6986054.1 unnamed protein product [Tilletia controversa]
MAARSCRRPAVHAARSLIPSQTRVASPASFTTATTGVLRRVHDRGSAAKVEQICVPAPPELAISIFWDMLQSGASLPPPVYTNLLHYYTKLVKA